MKKFLIGLGIGAGIEILIILALLAIGSLGWAQKISSNGFILLIFLPTPLFFISLQYLLIKRKPYDLVNGLLLGTVAFFIAILILFAAVLVFSVLSGQPLDS
jgi:hypothetical protein